MTWLLTLNRIRDNCGELELLTETGDLQEKEINLAPPGTIELSKFIEREFSTYLG